MLKLKTTAGVLLIIGGVVIAVVVPRYLPPETRAISDPQVGLVVSSLQSRDTPGQVSSPDDPHKSASDPVHGHDNHAVVSHVGHRHHSGKTSMQDAHAKGATAGAAIAIGQKVPDFSVTDLDGTKLTLAEIRKDGKRTRKGVVVLTFWCSFCGSCRRVEHSLDALAKDYQGTAAIMALDASAGETAQGVRAFARKEALSVPIVIDPTGHAADLFGTQVTTTTVVIDGDGVLRYCGRFGDGNHAYTKEALEAVLAGEEVKIKMTDHDG